MSECIWSDTVLVPCLVNCWFYIFIYNIYIYCIYGLYIFSACIHSMLKHCLLSCQNLYRLDALHVKWSCVYSIAKKHHAVKECGHREELQHGVL